jgi:hypothetical protein
MILEGKGEALDQPIFPFLLRTILAAQEDGKKRPAVLCERVREEPVILDPVGGVIGKEDIEQESAGSCGRAELDDGSVHLPRPGPGDSQFLCRSLKATVIHGDEGDLLGCRRGRRAHPTEPVVELEFERLEESRQAEREHQRPGQGADPGRGEELSLPCVQR